jgi:hypothetical protein
LGAANSDGHIKVITDKLRPGGGGGDERVGGVEGLLNLSVPVIVRDLVLEEVDDTGLARKKIRLALGGFADDKVVHNFTARYSSKGRLVVPEIEGTISKPKVLLLIDRLQVPPITTEKPVTLRAALGVTERTLSHAP